MASITTFSRTFPAYHPKKNQPTFFVEMILNELGINYRQESYYQHLVAWNNDKIKDGRLTVDDLYSFYNSLNRDIVEKKLHTIRNGNSRHVGDMFKPCVWSDKVNPKSGRKGAYHSPQIQFAHDTEIKKVCRFDIEKGSKSGGVIYVDNRMFAVITREHLNANNHHCENLKLLAKNDGLLNSELLDWFKFPSPLSGQTICWNENIEY